MHFKESYKQLYPHKLEKLNEMDKFFERQTTKEEINNPNDLKSIKEIEFVITNLSQ